MNQRHEQAEASATGAQTPRRKKGQTAPKARLAHMRTADREGNAAVFVGHGHSREVIADLAEPVIGTGPYEVVEVWMHYTPRVKWCERIDGFGCDSNGDWHGHWHGIFRNPDHPEMGAQTVVYPRADR